MIANDLTTLTIGERLRRARLFAGIEQAQMAELIGRSRTTISGYELNRWDPAFSIVVRWAEVTGVSLDWIAHGTEKIAA